MDYDVDGVLALASELDLNAHATTLTNTRVDSIMVEQKVDQKTVKGYGDGPKKDVMYLDGSTRTKRNRYSVNARNNQQSHPNEIILFN